MLPDIDVYLHHDAVNAITRLLDSQPPLLIRLLEFGPFSDGNALPHAL